MYNSLKWLDNNRVTKVAYLEEGEVAAAHPCQEEVVEEEVHPLGVAEEEFHPDYQVEAEVPQEDLYSGDQEEQEAWTGCPHQI